MLENKIIGHIENGVYVIDALADETDKKPLPENVPAFDGGDYDGVYSSGDSAFIVCINNALRTDFENYLLKLKNNGFKVFAKNEIAENVFYTFENGECYVFAYWIEALKSVKIIAEPYYLFVSETKEENIVKPAIIASSNCDRNFYVRLPDNSLVIIDGGWRIEDWSRYTPEELINEMYDEMRSITGTEIIKIPLWIITHGHTDHVRVAEYLYTLPVCDKFKIDRILYNFPATNHTDDGIDPSDEQKKTMDENLEKWHKNAGIDFPYEKIFYNCPFGVYDTYNYENVCRAAFEKYNAVLIKAHSGMKINICGVVFEVLHTPEDDMPAIFKNKNDSSIIIKMTYKGSSMLWLGDMGEIPSTSCVKMYGDYLKSDAMQVSHHGWGAATPEFYDVVKPSVLFWNNSEFGFKYADKYQGYGKTKTSTDLYNMDCVKKNFFCNRIKMSYAYLPVNINMPQINSNKSKLLASAVSDRTFMLKLSNGKIIIIDATWRETVWEELDKNVLMQKMYEEMCLLSGGSKVNIAAFISTDSSNSKFWDNINDFGFKKNVNIEKIICNSYNNEKFKSLNSDVILAKTGETFDIYNSTVKILYSNETLIFKISVDDSDLIFTGDMNDSESKKLISEYGDNLSCDVVQIANGGYDDCGIIDFYKLCAAKLQIWNNSEYAYRFFKKNEGYKKTNASTEAFWLNSCKLNVFCDQVKPQIFSIPLNEDELAYFDNSKKYN